MLLKNGEKVLKVNEKVAEAVKSNDRDFNHVKPYLGSGNERQDVPKTLQHVLSQQECQCSPESREMVNSTIFIYDRNVSGISINIITNKIL